MHINKIIRLDMVESTMDEANQLISQGETENFAIVAKGQTKGRGRNGKKFITAHQKGLWCTLAIKESQLPPFKYIQNLSVTLNRLLDEFYQIKTHIKWPNDLFIGHQKVCGILAEKSNRSDYLLLGFGLNVFQQKEDFPEEIQNIATSLQMHTVQPIQMEDLLENILQAYMSSFKQEQDDIEEIYQNNLYLRNQWALLDEKRVLVLGVSPQGELLIQEQNKKEKKILAGDLLPL